MVVHMEYILGFLGLPGQTEWLIILLVALLIFGRRLPEIARGMGRSLTEFKKGLSETEDAKDEIVNDVKQIKDDVVDDAKKAAGLDEQEKSS